MPQNSSQTTRSRLAQSIELGNKIRHVGLGFYADLFSRGRDTLSSINAISGKYVNEIADKGAKLEADAQERFEEFRSERFAFVDGAVKRFEKVMQTNGSTEPKSKNPAVEKSSASTPATSKATAKPTAKRASKSATKRPVKRTTKPAVKKTTKSAKK